MTDEEKRLLVEAVKNNTPIRVFDINEGVYLNITNVLLELGSPPSNIGSDIPTLTLYTE
jgi:hypothetical protein